MKIKISDFLKNYLLENQVQYITKMNSFVEVVHMRWAPESWVSLSGLIKATPATVLDPRHSPEPSSPAPVMLQQSWSPAPTALSCPPMPLVSQAHPYILVQPQPVPILRDVSVTWSFPTAPGCLAVESVTRSVPSVRVALPVPLPLLMSQSASSSPGLTPCLNPMSPPGLLNS